MKDMMKKLDMMVEDIRALKEYIAGSPNVNKEIDEEDDIENGEQSYSKTSDDELMMKKKMLMKKMME